MKAWDGASKISNGCLFCKQVMETHEHLFFECSFSKQVWFEVRRLIRMENVSENLNSICNHMLLHYKKKEVWSIVSPLVLGAVVYFIWQERNSRIFTKIIRSYLQVSADIIQEVRWKLMTLPWKT